MSTKHSTNENGADLEEAVASKGDRRSHELALRLQRTQSALLYQIEINRDMVNASHDMTMANKQFIQQITWLCDPLMSSTPDSLYKSIEKLKDIAENDSGWLGSEKGETALCAIIEVVERIIRGPNLDDSNLDEEE